MGYFLRLVLVFWMSGQFLMGCGEDPVAPPVDPDAHIVLLAPGGGETVRVGGTLHIRWKLQGRGLEEINAVNIEASPDSGRIWIGLLTRSITPADSAWGDFAWTVPATLVKLGQAFPLAGSAQVLLRVMQYSTGDPDKIATLARPIVVSAP